MLFPPVADKIPVQRTHHGYTVTDNYEWMRAKEDPKVISYLEAENAYTDQQTAELEELRTNIFEEIKRRTKETDMSVPTRSFGYWYFNRIVAGQNYGAFCRMKVEDEDSWIPPTIEPGPPLPGEEVILDCDALSQGHDFFSMGGAHLRHSTNRLIYSVDTKGDERYTLFIKDLTTGELLDDIVENVAGCGSWISDEHIIYERVDDAWRPYQVWRHKLGTPVEEDVLVYEEKDERFWLGSTTQFDSTYAVISISSKTTSEQWILDVRENPEGEFQCIRPRQTDVEYAVEVTEVAGERRLLVLHNFNDVNYELSEGPVPSATEYLDFTTLNSLIAPSEDARIEGVDTYKRFIVASYRRAGLGRVAVMKLGEHGYTDFEELRWDEELVSSGAGGGGQWDCPVLRVSYASYTEPATLFQLDATQDINDAEARIVLRKGEVLGGYDSADYTAYRVWAPAADGVQIPVSVIHRRDLDMSASHPLYLYGYGSYEHSLDPGMSISRLSMLDRGLIVAIAHVRGGGEMGRTWYDDGKMLRKKNTFTDFIDVAKHLIDRGMTTPDQLVASGGSAGGLLMGAVANMAPNTFKAILAEVPFVDALTSILMPELPLTVIEWDEWGNPLEDKEVYEYMASYSPYENIEAKKYPNILAMTSLNDTRVLYVEPAKWIAKLRDTATGGEFLLRTDMSSGHGGASGRYDSWRQTAFVYAWAINQVTGLTK
ncbi:MAG: S9 family peptidase [Corynebacterium sp.]|nr:S9 family peptidase [Corynebacterium sp.]